MDKELSDRAWGCLPREFREEVKKLARLYSGRTSALFGAERHLANKFLDEFIGLFGRHNLTSDAEEEEDEMLCVRRKEVQGLLSACNRYKHKCFIDGDSTDYLDGEINILTILFGSKCLPDEAQPKQKDCDNPLADKEGCRWRNDGKCAFDSACYFEPLNPQEPQTAEPKEVTKMKPIESKVSVYLATKEEDEEFRMLLHENGFKWNTGTSLINCRCWKSDIEESKIHYIHPDKTVTYYGKRMSETLTFSEFKKQYFGENVNHRQFIAKCDKQFDNILKGSFLKERRLSIAVQMVKAITQCPEIIERIASAEADSLLDDIVDDALHLTDRLIDECEKGGSK